MRAARCGTGSLPCCKGTLSTVGALPARRADCEAIDGQSFPTAPSLFRSWVGSLDFHFLDSLRILLLTSKQLSFLLGDLQHPRNWRGHFLQANRPALGLLVLPSFWQPPMVIAPKMRSCNSGFLRQLRIGWGKNCAATVVSACFNRGAAGQPGYKPRSRAKRPFACFCRAPHSR